MLLVLQEYKLCKTSFAFYLLPVAGVLSKMFSTQTLLIQVTVLEEDCMVTFKSTRLYF